MNTVLPQTYTKLTRRDMLEAGFTATQVDALEALRANYPFVEFFDSRQELERLHFMKWMIGRMRSLQL